MTTDDFRELLRQFMKFEGERIDPVLRICLAAQEFFQDKRDAQKEAAMFDDEELDRFFDGLMSDDELAQFFAELEAKSDEVMRALDAMPMPDLNTMFSD